MAAAAPAAMLLRRHGLMPVVIIVISWQKPGKLQKRATIKFALEHTLTSS
jgi:hypothetical protein